ncbi:cysteine desulfurase [Dellaglioa algida]|uniref:cysteine desulfurase n=1 Tax=Dellaglioa algida TaxID=105612 RepID=UPI0024C4D010|nr:cysteine desulfurase [Dellaglioa algida]MDK1726104.1 cysteine desulfurase [Dellaglioa algida]
MAKNLKKYRADFPILKQLVNDEPLIYFDNAATVQKPQVVIDTISHYYEHDNANVHRGVHTLAERATEQFEATRQLVADFIHSKSANEILFTKGTTESLNLVAQGFAQNRLKPGDEILISIMEHHSNLVPWQQVAQKTGAKLVYVGLTDDGRLDINDARQKMTGKTKIVSLTQISNVLGSITPIKELTRMAHHIGAIVICDGAQSVPNMPIDVRDLDVDFFAFSGHKMGAATGIGVLYGKNTYLNDMQPLEFGGEMIDFVEEQRSTFKEVPWKFEAGTPNIEGVISLGATINYLKEVGMVNIHAHEQVLVADLIPMLKAIPGVVVYGPTDIEQRSGVISFNLENLHPHDVATALDMQGIAVRAGHHCAQPLMKRMGVSSTVRISLYLYNTLEENQKFIEALIATKEFFKNGTI